MNIKKMNGLELLKAMIKGVIPPPTMAATIPMQLLEAEKGYVKSEARANKNHLNPMGKVHGGFAATVLDSVTACAVHTLLGPGDTYGTIDLNVKMLRPVPADTVLIAESKVIHCTKRLGVSEGDLKDENGNILAHATAMIIISRKID